MITNTLVLSKLAQITAVALAVTAVALADVLLKKVTAQGSLHSVLRSPLLAWAIGLYLFQIGFFVAAFLAGWKLSVIGALQTAVYALIVLAAGALLYHESLSRVQIIGVLLAFGGVVLLNW